MLDIDAQYIFPIYNLIFRTPFCSLALNSESENWLLIYKLIVLLICYKCLEGGQETHFVVGAIFSVHYEVGVKLEWTMLRARITYVYRGI